MLRYHTEAGGTAILGIQLEVVREIFHYKVLWMDMTKIRFTYNKLIIGR